MYKIRKKWGRYAVVFEFDNGNYWMLSEYMGHSDCVAAIRELEENTGKTVLLGLLQKYMEAGCMNSQSVIRGLLKAGITEDQIDATRESANEVMQGIW